MRLEGTIGAIVVASACTASAHASLVPFTEGFDSNVSSWRDSTGNAELTWFNTGGPGGSGDGYASGMFNFTGSAAGDTPVILRGQDGFDSSDDAFVGDWITGGVTEFSFDFRHDAPVPVNVFTRFASSFNFPGAVAVDFVPVLPNTWTEVTIAIEASNPQFISFSGQSFEAVFSSIGNLQIGIDVPVALAGFDADFTFDLDNVSIVPTPGAAVLLAGAPLAVRRRRRRG